MHILNYEVELEVWLFTTYHMDDGVLSMEHIKTFLQSACFSLYWKIMKFHIDELLSVQKLNLSCNSD